MKKEQAAEALEILSEANPERHQRVVAIRDAIAKLPEIPAYKDYLGNLDKQDYFEGEGLGEVKFKACLISVKGKDRVTKLLRVDIFGEHKMRAKTVIDFLLALHRGPDARAGAHDDIDDRFQDQLYWRMPN